MLLVTETFSPKVQSGPGVHPAPYSRSSGALSPGVKRPQRESELRKRGAASLIPLYTFMSCAGKTLATTFTKSQPYHCTACPTPTPVYVRSAVILYPCVQTDLNPLTPNERYRGRTAPLTSEVAFYIFIQQIWVLNILNMVYTLRFFSSKCSLFHNSNIFGSRIIHILYTGCAKIKNNSGPKG